MDKILSINYHLTKMCNMSCKGCFSQHRDINNCYEFIKILEKIVDYAKINKISKRKINFVGGEPTLVKDLPIMVKFMNSNGFKTSIVTNGSFIDQKYLDNYEIKPDWIGLSIDSFNKKTNIKLGRVLKNEEVIDYLEISKLIKANGINLKINTMVNQFNYKEDMSTYINLIKPKRWKIFQFLKINGENDGIDSIFSITKEEFNHFVNINSNINNLDIIKEDNEDMIGSYLMVSPEGSLYDNTKRSLTYSKSLEKYSFKEVLNDIEYNENKLIKRGGVYNW